MQYEFIKKRGAINSGQTGDGPDVRPRPRPHVAEKVNLAESDLSAAVVDLLPESVARENGVIPIELRGEQIVFAAARPDDIATADKLRFILNRDVVMAEAPRHEIEAAISKYYGGRDVASVDSMLQCFTETAIDFTQTDDDLLMEFDGYKWKTNSYGAFGTKALRARETTRGFDGSRSNRGFDTTETIGGNGMFFYTVEEGQQALMRRPDGTMDVLVGPRRVWRGRSVFQPMAHYVAHPGEFLIVRKRDGSQMHLAGPDEVWFDPREHESVTREDCLQIAAREAVVVYSKDEQAGDISRRVVHGPALFVPQPGEWLHTFSWHASKGGSKGVQKIPNGLVFQKLWMMPDQMYHDVPDVRTSDDAVLTVRLMLFFELLDIERMLETTHDPVGDFVNAATADVVEFVGRFDFESFKQNTDRLNDLDTYRQLTSRAAQCGYRINNVVYRGYGAPESLQQMHDQAIETRTRLQLERATEEQAQDLEDYKLNSQLARASKRREEQTDEVRHDLELSQEKIEAEVKRRDTQQLAVREQQRKAAEVRDEIQRRENATHQEFLVRLKEMNVDLTQYLTQERADRVIEVRGEGTPHLHLDRDDERN